MKLSLTDTNSMKGVAITFIVWHNLIHWLIPLKENEFTFNIDYSKLFWEHIKELDSSLWMDIFSFLGWYGVPVFLFVSGYGLVKKYEDSQLNIAFKDFAYYHVKKLFTLMVLPYLVYLILVFYFEQTVYYLPAVFQITMLSNLYPPFINPGIYWFWGLMLQLYICYYMCFYKRKNIYLLYFNILSIVTMVFFIIFTDNPFLMRFTSDGSHYLSYIRHNFIGWILPFTFGIFYARSNWNIVTVSLWKNILILVVGILLLVFANFNVYTWLFSPFIAIIIAIVFNSLMKNIRVFNNILIYLGSISAFLFAIHPLVRYVYVKTINSSDFIWIAIYFVLSIIIAIGFKWVYKLLY